MLQVRKQERDGIIVDIYEVQEVVNTTGTDFGGWIPDISVTVTAVNSMGYERNLRISGNFRHAKDEEGNAMVEVEDWGGAFKVRDLFTALGVEGDLADDNTIPPEWLETGKDKKVQLVSYKTAKGWRTWDRVWPIEANIKAIKEAFLTNVERGYPKDFSGPQTRSSPVSESTTPDTTKHDTFDDQF